MSLLMLVRLMRSGQVNTEGRTTKSNVNNIACLNALLFSFTVGK